MNKLVTLSFLIAATITMAMTAFVIHSAFAAQIEGCSGNPHVDGESGNPHDDGESGNPHNPTQHHKDLHCPGNH